METFPEENESVDNDENRSRYDSPIVLKIRSKIAGSKTDIKQAKSYIRLKQSQIVVNQVETPTNKKGVEDETFYRDTQPYFKRVLRAHSMEAEDREEEYKAKSIVLTKEVQEKIKSRFSKDLNNKVQAEEMEPPKVS